MDCRVLWAAAAVLAVAHLVSSDIITGQVIVPSSTPTVSNVGLRDIDGGTIQLTAGSDNIVLYCNARATDDNGFGDVAAAWATIYNGTSAGASADPNTRYDNGSCSLSGGGGSTVNINCSFNVQHEAVNGTWTCNVTVNDSASNVDSNTGVNTVDDLTAISIFEATVDFGTLALGGESGGGNATEVSNQGNVVVDVRVNGTDYVCTGQGTIPVNNTRYSTSDGGWAGMSLNLTHAPVTDTGFDLGVEGIVTAEGVNATKDEYWTVAVPSSGVGGTCTNNIQITGVYGG